MPGLLPEEARYNTFAGTQNQFGGAVNRFAGQRPTLQPTIREAVSQPPVEPSNPFRGGGPGGNAARVLAEQERQRYKEYQDWYFRTEAAKKAHQAQISDDVGSSLFGGRSKYYYDSADVPDWIAGRGVELPKDSTFQFTQVPGRSFLDPTRQWNEFLSKWRENKEYDKYTGVFHSDYYPQEWIDMARYFDYVEKNT